MPSIDKMVKTEIRKLARQGKLIDTTYKMFQRQVFPDAPPDEVAALRIGFFAGVAEAYALLSAGLDDGLHETDGDLHFMQQWVVEVETFHARTIAASKAQGRAQ